MIPVSLARVVQSQGFVTVAEARSCGVDWPELRQLVKAGFLARLRAGAYWVP